MRITAALLLCAIAVGSTAYACPPDARDPPDEAPRTKSVLGRQYELATSLLKTRVRVVVLDFDGFRARAEPARDLVLSLLGPRYTLVSQRDWERAYDGTDQRGPDRWRRAAKQARVDAIIEGWIQSEGRHYVLTIAVREAATGTEIDTVTVRIGEKEITDATKRRLAGQLDDLATWVVDAR